MNLKEAVMKQTQDVIKHAQSVIKLDDEGKIADFVSDVIDQPFPIQLTAYDGSLVGNQSSEFRVHIKSLDALRYLITAPGDLGVVRAYLQGELELHGVSAADPYPALANFTQGLSFKRPSLGTIAGIVKTMGFAPFKLMPVPEIEQLPRWRRILQGIRHSKIRDAQSIKHHYDVSNTFYEWVLGPSMAYTCATYPHSESSLEEAQENKFRLVFDKLNLQAGQTLLDVGCGWGSMVRYAARQGVKATGVTLSCEQAEWAQAAIRAEGLEDLAEVRYDDYRNITETNFDAISSIGLTEHIGVRNYPAYFEFLHSKLKTGGMLLNHCITRPHNRNKHKAGAFIDRYIFPDGELTGSGKIISTIQNGGGFEVIHSENLREHYAFTLRDWNRNLTAHWEEAVAEVGEEIAKLWGLYLAACRLGFETDTVELHQILAVKKAPQHTANYPLRPWWKA